MILLLIALPAIFLAASIPLPPGHLDVCFRGPFRGITATTLAGVVIGDPDRNDWGCLGARRRRIALPEGGPVDPPSRICFEPAFPNPVDESTSLRFSLPRAARVVLIVYRQNFRRGPFGVFPSRTLVDGEFAAGFHQALWNLDDDHGARVPRGIYRAVLRVEGHTLCGDIEVR